MVDKFVDSVGKTVLRINDDGTEEVDPTLVLKEDSKNTYIICSDCKHGVIGEFIDTRTDECQKCGS